MADIGKYLEEIRAAGGKEPRGWRDDPFPMQIAKLDNAARKARG